MMRTVTPHTTKCFAWANWAHAPRVLFFLIILLQLAFTFKYLPFAALVNNLPFAPRDFGLHFYNALAASNFVHNSQHTWGYDPFFMAGYPSNILDNLDNRLIEIGVAALGGLGKARAFDVLIIALFIGVPFIVYWTARNWGLNVWGSALASAFAVLVFQFDALARFMWLYGIVSFLAASYFAPFVLSWFGRFIERPSLRIWFALMLSHVLISLLHGFAFFILLVPSVVLYILAWRKLKLTHHLALAAILFLVVLANAEWLITSLHYLSLLRTGSTILQAGLPAIRSDLSGVLGFRQDSFTLTAGVRFSFLILGFGGALYWWRRTHSRSAIVIASAIISLNLFAYVGIPGKAFDVLEPYRYVLPATFFACFPTAFLLTEINWNQFFQQRTHYWQVRIGLAAVAVLFVLATTARVVAAFALHPNSIEMWTVARNAGLEPTNCQLQLFQWISSQTTPDARILIQDTHTGALLPYFVKRQIIGGPFERRQLLQNFAQASYASIFDTPIQNLTPTILENDLHAFNIGWVVSDDGENNTASLTNFIRRNNLPFLVQVGTPCDYSVYRTTVPPSYFLQGTGQVQAEYNLLRVTNASAGTVILKYHWLDTLRTDPPLKISPYPIPRDPAPFIQIENGSVQNFSVYNSYSY